jgi:hypothetical protein
VTGITVEGLLSHNFAGFDALRRKAGPSTALASLRSGRDDRDRNYVSTQLRCAPVGMTEIGASEKGLG